MVRTLKNLGFEVIREHEHINVARRNTDGTTTPLTLPNQPRISFTLRTICARAGIDRDDLLRAYERS